MNIGSKVSGKTTKPPWGWRAGVNTKSVSTSSAGKKKIKPKLKALAEEREHPVWYPFPPSAIDGCALILSLSPNSPLILSYETNDTLSATQSRPSVSSFVVPLQRSLGDSVDKRLVFPNNLADIPCTSLGAEQLLETLNHILEPCFNTSLSFDDKQVKNLLESFAAQELDTGMAYALVRPIWPEKGLGQHRSHREFFDRLSKATKNGEKHELRGRSCVDGMTILNPSWITPRRLWDLYANRVIPFYYKKPWEPFLAVSHSWADDMVLISTPINGHEWPVPVPSGISLESVRIELLNHGFQYVWVDVLCLRQRCSDTAKEALRKQEWAVDVPTIGPIFMEHARTVLQYMNGLGRAFSRSGWDHPRHWTKRAWTLQEMSEVFCFGGVPEGVDDLLKEQSIETGELFETRVRHSFKRHTFGLPKPDEFVNAVRCMRERYSSNPVDKIACLITLLHPINVPMYDETMSEEDAWALGVQHAGSHVWKMLLFGLCSLEDGDVAWRPSWKRLMCGSLSITGCDQLVFNPEPTTMSIDEAGHLVYEEAVVQPTKLVSNIISINVSRYPDDDCFAGSFLISQGIMDEKVCFLFRNHKPQIPEGEPTFAVRDLDMAKLTSETSWVVVCVKKSNKFRKVGVAQSDRRLFYRRRSSWDRCCFL